MKKVMIIGAHMGRLISTTIEEAAKEFERGFVIVEKPKNNGKTECDLKFPIKEFKFEKPKSKYHK